MRLPLLFNSSLSQLVLLCLHQTKFSRPICREPVEKEYDSLHSALTNPFPALLRPCAIILPVSRGLTSCPLPRMHACLMSGAETSPWRGTCETPAIAERSPGVQSANPKAYSAKICRFTGFCSFNQEGQQGSCNVDCLFDFLPFLDVWEKMKSLSRFLSFF